MNNYSENILQAVDMVVTERLKGINFDKTIIGKVVKANDNGSYTISYEAMTLLAYPSGSEEYDEGSQVYVLIPQGDYNLRKIITGRVGAKEIANYLYLNPGKQLVPIELYNGDNTNGIDINLRDFSNESTDLPTVKYLYFSADFKTIPGKKDDMKEYGIQIKGKGYFKEPKGEQEYENFVWDFMSSQFQGNPYMFNGLFKQEYLFDIEQYNKIENLLIEPVEDTLFKMYNIKLATGYAVESAPSSMKTGKIVLYEKNAKEKYPTPDQKDLALGQLETNEVYKTFELQTKFFLNNQLIDTPLKYSDKYPYYTYKWFIYNKEALDMGNGKHWGLLVVDENGTSEYLNSTLELDTDTSKFIKLNNEKIINATIPNYEEKALQVAVQVCKIDKIMKKDEKDGTYTRLLNNPKDLYGQTVYKEASEKYNNTVNLINQQTTWPWKYNKADTDNYYLTDGEEYTTKEIALTEALAQYNEALRDIVAEEKIATSNILPLLRSDQKTIEDALKGSGVELTAADDGTYFIYDGTTNLVDKELKKNKTFRITAKLTGAAKWTTGQTLRWKIPKKGTMIAAPNPTKYNTKDTMELDPNKAFLTEDDKWYIIEDTVVADTNPILDFDVSDIYDPAATMNVIRCEVGEIDSHIEQYIQGLQEDYQKLFDEYLELIDMGQTEEDETLKALKEQLNKAQINFMDEWAKSTQKNMVEQVGSGILLTFGVGGAQGTEYTIGISFDKTCITPGEILKAKAHFYNPAGQDITDQIGNNNFQWTLSQRGDNISISKDGQELYEKATISENKTEFTEADKYYYISGDQYIKATGKVIPEREYYTKMLVFTGSEVEIKGSKEVSNNYFALLNLRLKYQDINILQGENINFETFKPIPFWTGAVDSIPVFTGPTTVIYNSQGNDRDYIESEYTLGDLEITTSIFDAQRYGIELANNKLLMPQMISTNIPKVTVKLSAAADTWYQPLAIYRNEYTSAILNSWGGEQIINENGNKILTKMIGVGVKDDQNRFSGVFMGAVGKETTGEISDNYTGLYGYQDGSLRFKFTEKGDAYIGTGADNCISFNEKNNQKLKINTEQLSLISDDIILDTEGVIEEGYSDPTYFKLGEHMALIGDTLNISSSVKIGDNTLADTLKTTVKQEYAYSDSNTQTPEKWSDNLDSTNTNLYLWIRTTTFNSVSKSSSVLYEKSYNPNGKEQTQWYRNNSTSVTPDKSNTWLNTYINPTSSEKYVWERKIFHFDFASDKDIVLINPFVKSAYGEQGLQGIPGEAGKDGTSVNIKGSVDSVDELPKNNNTNGDAYLVNGILWVWDGINWVEAGQIQGPAGESSYIHVKYSNDMISFTDDKENAIYLGIQISTNSEASNKVSDYSWTNIKGKTGEPGANGVGIKTEITLFGLFVSDEAANDQGSYHIGNNSVIETGQWYDNYDGVLKTFVKLDNKNNYKIYTVTLKIFDNESKEWGKPTSSSGYTKVAEWCSKNDTTMMDGGFIAAGTIVAEKLKTLDFTVNGSLEIKSNNFSVSNDGYMEASSGRIAKLFLMGSKMFSLSNDPDVTVSGINGRYSHSWGDEIFLWAGATYNTNVSGTAADGLPESWGEARKVFGADGYEGAWTKAANIITGKSSEGEKAKFYVTHEGKLYCQGAEIEGTLKAGSIIGINSDDMLLKLAATNNTVSFETEQVGKTSHPLSQFQICLDGFVFSNDIPQDLPGVFGLNQYQFNDNGFTMKIYGLERFKMGRTALSTPCDIRFTNALFDERLVENHKGKSLITLYSDPGVPICYRGPDYSCRLEFSAGDQPKATLHGSWTGTSSWSTTSDLNQKNTINLITNNYSILFDNLRPVTYKYNNGTSDRLHTGFIAQQVKDALDIANIDSKDFAGLVIFDQGTDKEEWTLRYEEFIALNTWQIQKLKTRVSELETELAEIKEKLK